MNRTSAVLDRLAVFVLAAASCDPEPTEAATCGAWLLCYDRCAGWSGTPDADSLPVCASMCRTETGYAPDVGDGTPTPSQRVVDVEQAAARVIAFIDPSDPSVDFESEWADAGQLLRSALRARAECAAE